MAVLSEESYDFIFKIVVIGDKSVGKSSLIRRFREDKFDTHLPGTIGVDFQIKDIEINDVKIKLQLWDTAGEEEYKAVTSVYYRGAHAAMIIFDITRPETLENAKRWREEVLDKCGSDVYIIFIGNKCDLEPKIDFTELQNFCELNMIYWTEASAKNATYVDEIFIKTTKDLVELRSQLLSMVSMNNGPDSLFLAIQDTQLQTSYCCSYY